MPKGFNCSRIAVFIFTFFVIIGQAFAIEEAATIDLYQSVAYQGCITFDDVMQKAKEHSYDLKIADFNTLISKQDIRAARSEYFPRLNLSAGTEYTKNYRDIRDTTVMTIGEAFINPYTRYQSLLGITLSYNLFDFGVRRGNLDIAKEEASLKDLERQQKLQELYLNLVDTYAKILISKKQIDLNKEILAIEQTNLKLKTRLYRAREISRTEFNDAKISVEKTKQKISELTGMLSESLEWLSFYTGEKYDIRNLQIEDMQRAEFSNSTDYKKSLVWRVYERQIKKKSLEVKVAKRNYLPKVAAYSRYYLYGSNYNSYNSALGNIEPSNFTVGAMANMPIFDGFKNSSIVQKASLGLEQMKVERDKAVTQYIMRLKVMKNNLAYLEEQIENNKQIINELQDKTNSTSRLASKRLISPIEQNETKIELLNEQIEFEKNMITLTGLTKGLQILTEDQI